MAGDALQQEKHQRDVVVGHGGQLLVLGTLGVISKIGRYFIMIAMGAEFVTWLMMYFGMSIDPFFAMFKTPGNLPDHHGRFNNYR